MNIGVADDQSKQRLGLRKDGCDLGSETPEKGFADRAGSVHGERDAPHSSGAGGALERQVDTFALSEIAFQRLDRKPRHSSTYPSLVFARGKDEES